MEKMDGRKLLLVSLMIFSMFFGAGNLIFPPMLGQLSGTNLVISMGGFFISAVGLPILAIAAVAKVGGLHTLASRVHPRFALAFTVLIYLSIGPFLGILLLTTLFDLKLVALFGQEGQEVLPSRFS